MKRLVLVRAWVVFPDAGVLLPAHLVCSEGTAVWTLLLFNIRLEQREPGWAYSSECARQPLCHPGRPVMKCPGATNKISIDVFLQQANRKHEAVCHSCLHRVSLADYLSL